MTEFEIGIQYLDALEDARCARKIWATNDGDRYDPCGETEKRITAEFEAAIKHLAWATKVLVNDCARLNLNG